MGNQAKRENESNVKLYQVSFERKQETTAFVLASSIEQARDIADDSDYCPSWVEEPDHVGDWDINRYGFCVVNEGASREVLDAAEVWKDCDLLIQNDEALHYLEIEAKLEDARKKKLERDLTSMLQNTVNKLGF